MFPSYLEVQKTGSQLFRASQTLLQLFGERKKWILLFGDQKMQFTTVRSKEKDYDIYLKSEKLVHSPCFLGDQKIYVHNCQEQGKRL